MTDEPLPIDGRQMTCDEFQQQLPELFESGIELDDHPHLLTCDNCAALVRDLKYIAQQAKLLLPIKDPDPKVWENIKASLDRGTEEAESSAVKRR